MKVYKDMDAKTAVLICNADELETLANACFHSGIRWLDKSHQKGEDSDTCYKIAENYHKILSEISDVVKALKIDQKEN